MADEGALNLKHDEFKKGLSSHGRTWRRRRRTKTRQNRPRVLLDPDYINLLKWAKHNGVVFDNVTPAIFQETGRGMMATRNIKNGGKVISVPARLLITPKTALQSVIGRMYQSIISKRGFKLSNKCILCVYLVYLRYLGSKSFWHPYIRTLPNEFNTPSYFDDLELKFLPTSCYKRSVLQRDELKKAFEAIKEILSGTLKDFDFRFEGTLTFDSFRWAWFVVSTRSVYLENVKIQHPGYHGDSCRSDNFALAPVLDLLNHNDMADMQAGISQTTKTYTITTVTEYCKGEQVFINYGPHDNNTLLIEYGFILPKHIHNSIKISPSLVYHILNLPNTPAVNTKLDIIRSNDFEKDFSCSYENGISWNLLTALRILALNVDAVSNWTQVFNDERSQEEEVLVYQWIDLIVSSVLKKLVEEDQSLVVESNVTTNIRLALELRKQEREILQKVLERLGKDLP